MSMILAMCLIQRTLPARQRVDIGGRMKLGKCSLTGPELTRCAILPIGGGELTHAPPPLGAQNQTRPQLVRQEIRYELPLTNYWAPPRVIQVTGRQLIGPGRIFRRASYLRSMARKARATGTPPDSLEASRSSPDIS